MRWSKRAALTAAVLTLSMGIAAGVAMALIGSDWNLVASDEDLVCNPDGFWVSEWDWDASDGRVNGLTVAGIDPTCIGVEMAVSVDDAGGDTLAATEPRVATADSMYFEFAGERPRIEDVVRLNVFLVGPGSPPDPSSAVSVSGADRYETALEASRQGYPEGLDPDGERAVIIATGMNWPDALGGTALAGALDGPVLLVRTHSVPSGVMEEITRLGARKAIILGGRAAVGDAVGGALAATLEVERLGGTDRYETARLIVSRVIQTVEASGGYDGVAFVATGRNFPDALAAAPLAAANGWPIFLVDSSVGLTPQTTDAMAGVNEAIVLGGEAAVSAEVESALTSHGLTVQRLSGPRRYETAAEIATYGVQQAGLHWNRVGFTNGENFPDALAGGVLQAKWGSVMLLTQPTTLTSVSAATISANQASISSVTFYGGLNAISQAVRDEVLSLAH